MLACSAGCQEVLDFREQGSKRLDILAATQVERTPAWSDNSECAGILVRVLQPWPLAGSRRAHASVPAQNFLDTRLECGYPGACGMNEQRFRSS